MLKTTNFYTKHLHGRWRCASSPSDCSLLALRHDKITGPSTSHHWTTPFYNCHAFPCTCYVDIYSAERTCSCQSPFPSLQLLAALTAPLVSNGVVTLRISHNEFHCRTRGGFPISYYVVCVQSCDDNRSGYIIRFSHFVFCITGCLWYMPSMSHIMWKAVTCGSSISVPDTFVTGYHTAPTHYWSVLLQSYPFEKGLSPIPNVIPVWVGGQMGYGPDLSWQKDCYLAISMSASLTSAAPLYCSSRPLALLCIWAKIRFFLGRVSLVKFWICRILIIVSSPQALCWDN